MFSLTYFPVVMYEYIAGSAQPTQLIETFFKNGCDGYRRLIFQHVKRALLLVHIGWTVEPFWIH
jgi:hypothetical protein